MALLLAQAIEVTSLRTAQQGTMSDDDLCILQVLLKAECGQRVSIRSMAARCSEAAQLTQRFKEEHPDHRLINQLVFFI